MSPTPHTAGPWTVTTDAQHTAELAIDSIADGRLVHIALVHGVGTDEETQANAALIAAAPALLEALRAYVDEANTHLMKGQPSSPFAMRLAAGKAAIAMAEGGQ